MHGCIDGYSRMITFLRASTNNCADTVLTAFQGAIIEFGLPSRVRMDKGGENVHVAQYMLEHPDRRIGRSSVIVGRSIHNLRIERLWQECWLNILVLFSFLLL